MKIICYAILVLLLSSFLLPEIQLEHTRSTTPKDSITLYFYYKASKKKTFYVYKISEIVFKGKTNAGNFVYDSLKIALDSTNLKDAYLPLSAICREGKKISAIEFHIQNIPGYNYILMEQNEFVKGQYIFKPYYFKSPITRPTKYD